MVAIGRKFVSQQDIYLENAYCRSSDKNDCLKYKDYYEKRDKEQFIISYRIKYGLYVLHSVSKLDAVFKEMGQEKEITQPQMQLIF